MKLIALIFSLFLCSVSFGQLNCSNWLSTPVQPSYFEVGEIDVPGNQITVEAVFNRTTPYLGGLLYAGDLVSKHNTPSDANYLLRPNDAEITTTDGYFRTPDICEIELNKTYHVAMVYNGSTLKFYRNGFLMSQIPATGTLFQNAWKTRIGFYEPGAVNTNFIGYINEVRIWNVARTQAQIQANMNTSLSNPASQAGLLGYYTFDNLQNKQGNATYNGTLGGSATINAVNPSCNLVIDSCQKIPVQSGSTIINEYTPVVSLDGCTNKLTVEDASKFNIGDTVLIIQMKGASIDSSNKPSFGIVTNYNNAGNYEFNYIKGKAGNVVELKNVLKKQYSFPNGKVQLVRVPYFQSYVVKDTLTCLPWDGKKGGVLVLNAANDVLLNADINVTGKGFRGGRSKNLFATVLNCAYNDFAYPNTSIAAADKGESIYEIGENIAFGKGPNSSGGGGGNGHNAGGGGGGNGGNGGFGGYQLEACGNAPFDNRGFGGNALNYNNIDNKIFLGGGGGSGHTDNAQGIDMNGGNGGGIAIIMANTLTNNGYKIISQGENAQSCDNSVSNCHDGSGGGGAGGTILIRTNNYVNNITIESSGGNGGNLVIFNPGSGAGRIGPGGGGGAGIVWFSQNTVPTNVAINSNAGNNGVILLDNNNPWGATSGMSGQILHNLQLPFSAAPFKPNIDSIRINENNVNCSNFNFAGLGYTNSYPVTQWQWNFGDNTFANTQNTSHLYNTSGIYNVQLTAIDINGCKDSFNIAVNVPTIPGIPSTAIIQPSCITATGTISITSPLGSSYQYSINGTNYQSSPNFTNLASGSYNITVKDVGTSCISAQAPAILNDATPPTSATFYITQPTCVNSFGTINITAPLGTAFQYSIDGNNYQGATSFSSLPSGLYNLTVKNINNGCISISTAATINSPLSVPAIPTFNITQPICNNQAGSINVLSPLGTNFQYSINNINFQNAVNFTNVNPGTYSIVVKNINSGCLSSSAIATINPGTASPPAPSANVNSQPDCIKQTGTITVAQPIGNNYQYSLDGISYQPATIFNTVSPGDYNIIVRNLINGCISPATSVKVNAVPLPPASPSINITQPTCAITTGTINIAAPIGNNFTYSINNANFQAANSFTGLAPAAYNVIVKNMTTQCVSSATVAVVNTIPSPPALPTLGNIIQPTCAISKGTVTIAAPLGANLEYSVNGTVYQALTTFENLSAGSYNFTVKDITTSCISSSVSAVINPPPPLPPTPVAKLTAQPDCIISVGTIVINSPVGNNYEYSLDGLNFQSSNTFVGLPPGTYNVFVKDISIACLSLPTQVTVSVNTNNAGTYKIPNAFTPNNDGFNECFGIKYWGVISDFRLIIYNRFGQEVFSTSNANDCWDGKYKGVPASQGNYVYYIKAKTLCGLIEKRGNVLLIK